MYISSLLALKAFLNSVVADDLHVVTVDGATLTISRNNALDVVLGTYELKTPAPPEAPVVEKVEPELALSSKGDSKDAKK